MKPLFIALGAVLLFMAAGLYFNVFSPSAVMRSNTEKALQQFADAVETQDRAQISQALGGLLSEEAKIRLEVSFSAISSANLRPMTQDFDKASFLAFIDNVLYPMNDYHYRPSLTDFSLGDDDVAQIAFKSGQWGDGPSYFSGVSVQVHFSGDAQCTGEAVFENKQPKLRVVNCAVLLRSTTKSDSAGATVNKAQELRDMLNQQR